MMVVGKQREQHEQCNCQCHVICAAGGFHYAEIVQGERKDASLLAIFAEPQPILCKDTTTNSVDMKNDFIFRSLHHLYSK